MLNELEPGELNEIERKIFEVLLKAPKGLIRIVFSLEPQRNLGSDPNDQKNCKGIESLCNKLIPIVSPPGEAGYRLDTSPDAIENMVMEWESCIAHLQ